MTVRSKDLPSNAAHESGVDWPIALGKVGMWLAVIAFGGVFWAINGGYSVLGLEVVARSFNSAGALFWYAMASIAVPVPVRAPGLPATQPLLPWLGVFAASLLQICSLYLTLSGRSVPRWMLAATTVLSLYDLGTTWRGIGTVEWIRQSGWMVQATLAVFLTFGFETIIGFALRRK